MAQKNKKKKTYNAKLFFHTSSDDSSQERRRLEALSKRAVQQYSGLLGLLIQLVESGDLKLDDPIEKALRMLGTLLSDAAPNSAAVLAERDRVDPTRSKYTLEQLEIAYNVKMMQEELRAVLPRPARDVSADRFTARPSPPLSGTAIPADLLKGLVE